MPLPHLISGHVYLNGNPVGNATVTYSSTVIISETDGSYVLTVSGNTGDVISVTAYKLNEGTKTVSITLEATPQTQDFNLEQSSDYSFAMHNTKNLVLSGVMLVDYEGSKITKLNPLPVLTPFDISMYSFDLVNNPSVIISPGSDGQPDYIEVIINSITYRKTNTYTDINGMRIYSGSSKWVRQ